MPEVVANGLRFHYQQTGSGPDVVLIHAVTANLAVWTFSGLPEAIAHNGFRVTTYDLRGHGVSERPPSGYTSADMATDFASLHQALGLSPSVVVGHSFGGVIATHTAVLFPELVRVVILSDSFFPGLIEFEPNFGRTPLWADLKDAFAKVGADVGDSVDFHRLFQTAAELPPERMAELETIYGPLGKGWLRQLPRLAETSCGRDVLTVAGLTATTLSSIKQPVVALYDEFSPFLATCHWLQTHVPRCEAEIIPAAKHLAVVENTEGFTTAVLKYLNRFR
jgi:pimeloyl-ACP methyl ester carboxylesterase